MATEQLQAHFDWAKQKDYPGGMGGEFAIRYFVYATLTIHTTTHRYDAVADQVLYANGTLDIGMEGQQEILTGNISGRANTASKDDPQDLFPASAWNFVIKVNATGFVSVQHQMNGKNFLGRGPDTFQGLSTGELITGVVLGKSYTLTFINGSSHG